MKKIIYILSISIFVMSCKDTTDDGPIISPGQDEPIGVNLVFPYQDGLCNEGTNLTPTESTVFFEWETNNNAETYTLTLDLQNSIEGESITEEIDSALDPLLSRSVIKKSTTYYLKVG